MKPVQQTLFGLPSGNCLAACVASILELDIDEVENFVEKKNWFLALCLWLEKRGMTAVRLDFAKGFPNVAWNFYMPPGTLVIFTGPSPRGDFHHCVVGQWDGKFIHDPHPDNSFTVDNNVVDVIALVRLP